MYGVSKKVYTFQSVIYPSILEIRTTLAIMRMSFQCHYISPGMLIHIVNSCGHRDPELNMGSRNEMRKNIVDLKQSGLSTSIQCSVKILNIAQMTIALLLLNVLF